MLVEKKNLSKLNRIQTNNLKQIKHHNRFKLQSFSLAFHCFLLDDASATGATTMELWN